MSNTSRTQTMPNTMPCLAHPNTNAYDTAHITQTRTYIPPLQSGGEWRVAKHDVRVEALKDQANRKWLIISYIQLIATPTLQNKTRQYKTRQYKTTQYNTMQYSSIQCYTIQHHTIQYNITSYIWTGSTASLILFLTASQLACVKGASDAALR
jgi:hypothetical protein